MTVLQHNYERQMRVAVSNREVQNPMEKGRIKYQSANLGWGVLMGIENGLFQ